MADATEKLETADASEISDWSAGGFQARLRERRAAVLEHIERQLNADAMAEVLFELLVHLALNPETELDQNLVESFAWRHEIQPSDVHVQDLSGQRQHLYTLMGDVERAATAEVLNALLTIGLLKKLKPLEDADQRSFILRIVGLLPGIERVGPYVITDYVDLLFAESDALKFWQLYTERVAGEVTKRSTATTDDGNAWLYERLEAFHAGGVMEARGRAWKTLREHIKRILRIDRNRSRFVRSLIEGMDDVAALHYVCSSLAMVEDANVLHALLTRGDEKQISCALFALQSYGDLDHVIGYVLEHFRTRPLPEIAHRVTEVYAQIHLPPLRNANLENLRKGLRNLVIEKVAEGQSVESLVLAIANDARALRHGLLVADLSTDEKFSRSQQGARLLDRGTTIFFQSFTPSALDHSLNDHVFRAGMQKVLRATLLNGSGRLRERLETFGMELSDHVDRWAGEGAPEALRGRLLARFAVDYARTLTGIARSLASEQTPEASDASRALYRTLIRVYLEHFRYVQGEPSFGAIEFALLQLFPDMQAKPVDRIGVGDIIDASHTMADLEQALGTFDDLVGEGANRGDRHAHAFGALLVRKPDRDKPLTAPIQLIARRQHGLSSVLRAYFGLDMLTDVKSRFISALGFKRTGEVILTDRELVITSNQSIGQKVIERSGDSHALDDLMAVRVLRRLRLFYVVLGVLGLVTAGILGGHLLFVALRGQEPTLGIVGASVLALGILFDAAMSRLSERNERSVVVEFDFKSRPRHFTVAIDAFEGAELLDAFMANDAERRELSLLDEWTGRNVEWEPLDAPIDLGQDD
ncbi:MAG: hypothetical protein VX589_20680 [Myxococcota bacterium]|nr:hypothetical protein [Myxococcota bacterium]